MFGQNSKRKTLVPVWSSAGLLCEMMIYYGIFKLCMFNFKTLSCFPEFICSLLCENVSGCDDDDDDGGSCWVTRLVRLLFHTLTLRRSSSVFTHRDENKNSVWPTRWASPSERGSFTCWGAEERLTCVTWVTFSVTFWVRSFILLGAMISISEGEGGLSRSDPNVRVTWGMRLMVLCLTRSESEVELRALDFRSTTRETQEGRK